MKTQLLGITLALSLLFSNSDTLATQHSTSMAEQLYTTQDAATPELAKAGSLTVGVTTITIPGPSLLKSKEERTLTLEVWYPGKHTVGAINATYTDVTRTKKSFTLQGSAFRDASPQDGDVSHPLIILSHGYTGYRSIMFYLGEHLASHGYVVAAIDHTDSTNSEVDFENGSGAGFQSTLLHRSRDQQATLDFFKKNGALWNVDSKRAGVIGYSMGGYGALNTVGACHSFSEEVASAFGFKAHEQQDILRHLNGCNAGLTNVDESWKAMVALAPWGGESGVISQLDKIRVPSLFIAGEQDDVSGYENGVKKLFLETGTKHKYLLVYQNARHNIAPHPAPKAAYENELGLGHYFEPAWNTETLNRINKHMILAFLNYHVKELSSFEEFLPKRENITQTKQQNGQLNQPWPGFKDRFGTGVLFFRGAK